jgi:hypothetical protein
MNELNLQNPEFRQMIFTNHIYRFDNQIHVNLSAIQIIGHAGSLPTLISFDSTVSPIQRWELFIPRAYFLSAYLLGPYEEARHFSGLTTFDEIKSIFG